jgi:2-dehydro-3-deoxygalactonokinase
MADPALLACDWGTTNLRAWTLDDSGGVLQASDFPLGVSRLQPGEAAERFAREVRPALGAQDVPAILCGMVGSNLGWLTASYAPCPTGLSDLAERMVTAEAGPASVRVVPGVAWDGFNGQGDVMRGEETQLFGWLAQHPDRAAGRVAVCHPGTHTKWMVVQDGRLTRFVTSMTGELFAILSQHSVLRNAEPADDMTAFEDGVAAAGAGDALAARLFTARARAVSKGARLTSGPSYLSGLLIGADVAASPQLVGIGPDEPIALLGDERLCAFYASALAQRGVRSKQFDGEAAAIAGLIALHRLGEPG